MQNSTVNFSLAGFCAGFYKIWRINKTTGESTLVVDKKNMILYQGADIMAYALAGVKNSSISHLYIGYNNNDSFNYPDDAPLIDKGYSVPFSSYGSGDYDDFGYLRIPLIGLPTFTGQTNYQNNVALFNAVVSGSDSQYGATFADSLQVHPSHIFEVALVNAKNPDNISEDKIFSRSNFTPLLYDANFNLNIVWGIQFRA